MFIPASMAFMVQSSCIIFTALCSLLLLHRRLNRLHLQGIGTVLLGIALVTIAGIIYTDHNNAAARQLAGVHNDVQASDTPHSVAHRLSSRARLLSGVLLTLVAQLAQALQFVSEEQLLQRTALHPLQVMGLEGVVASCFCAVLLVVASYVPGIDQPHLESWSDTMVQRQNSDGLVAMCLVFFAGLAGTNFFGLRVSSAL